MHGLTRGSLTLCTSCRKLCQLQKTLPVLVPQSDNVRLGSSALARLLPPVPCSAGTPGPLELAQPACPPTGTEVQMSRVRPHTTSATTVVHAERSDRLAGGPHVGRLAGFLHTWVTTQHLRCTRAPHLRSLTSLTPAAPTQPAHEMYALRGGPTAARRACLYIVMASKL